MADVKFCGLTREADAAHAGSLGATHAGVIFAGGPRLLTPDRARRVLDALPAGVRRVGVFGAADPAAMAEAAAGARLDVVQLHAATTAAEVEAARRATGLTVWAVARVADGRLPECHALLAAAADALVLDTLVPGGLGGSGVATDWEELARELDRHGRPARLVLAGGLRPETVTRAVALVSPDAVDVSSGVESAPGIKDHARMTAFAAAARGAPSTSRQPA